MTASSPPALVPARPAPSVVAAAAPVATRVAVVRASRLARPVAITARLFGFAAVAVLVGLVSTGAGLLLGLGAGGAAGPLVAAVVTAVLYAVPLWLLLSCRKALRTFPRFLDSLVWAPAAAPPAEPAEVRPERRGPRAPLRALRATGRLARGATGSVRAAAELSGLWRLASPVVSIGGAVAFVAAPALMLLGVAILLAGLVLA